MQLGLLVIPLVLATVGLTWGALRLLVAVLDRWLKRHIRRADRRETDRAERAYRRVVEQFDTQELLVIGERSSGGADAHSARAAGVQPAAARTAAVSERPFGALGCPTVPGNVLAGQAGGQSETGRHRRVSAAETLPAPTSRSPRTPPSVPYRQGDGLRRAS